MVDLVDTEPEHRYTVDEHTLMTVERATELASNTDPTRQRFAQLLSEIENPAVLVFALLFHSSGQGNGGDPLGLSMALARQAMERIRVPGEEQREVNFLIEHQSDLAEVMSGRDVDDPATARQLAERVGTIERLKLLTVMTYGDLAAVSSDAMTPWRLERLWRAYEVTQHELTRELETDRIQDVPDSVPGRPAFLKGFPVRYLRAHSPAEIEEHMRLYEESRPTGVAVQLDRIEGAYRLTVIARDMPALFASFAGAISSFGLDILKAEAFSNARGMILDTFVFADPQRTLELNPPESERLLDLIRRVALGKTDGQRLLRSRAQADPQEAQRAPAGEFRFRRLRYRHAGGNRRRGPARLVVQPGDGVLLHRLQYRCGADRHQGASRDRRILCRARRPEAVAGVAGDAEGKASGCLLERRVARRIASVRDAREQSADISLGRPASQPAPRHVETERQSDRSEKLHAIAAEQREFVAAIPLSRHLEGTIVGRFIHPHESAPGRCLGSCASATRPACLRERFAPGNCSLWSCFPDTAPERAPWSDGAGRPQHPTPQKHGPSRCRRGTPIRHSTSFSNVGCADRAFCWSVRPAVA